MVDTISHFQALDSKFGERITTEKVHICEKNFSEIGMEHTSK